MARSFHISVLFVLGILFFTQPSDRIVVLAQNGRDIVSTPTPDLEVFNNNLDIVELDAYSEESAQMLNDARQEALRTKRALVRLISAMERLKESIGSHKQRFNSSQPPAVASSTKQVEQAK